MFLLTQFIGIIVLNAYAPTTKVIYNETLGQNQEIIQRENLPFGLESGQESEPGINFISIIIALILAFLIFGFLMKYDLKYVIKIWFILVIFISLGITLYPLLNKYTEYAGYLALFISIPLVYFKIIKPNLYIHNITETLIYPGIASVMVSLIYIPKETTFNFFLTTLTLNKYSSIFFVILLLILISLYDAWAVWKSGVMQKMAKYQMEQLNIFGGFLFPTVSEKDKRKIKNIKEKYKNKNIPEEIKNRKFKVNLAILGGGDVIFPIITAGIFMWVYPEQILFNIPGLIPALFIISGATLGLGYLFLNTEKGKAYPAMPYISAGIFISIILWKIFF
jgi:presenilin-like A22 family membrane protease